MLCPCLGAGFNVVKATNVRKGWRGDGGGRGEWFRDFDSYRDVGSDVACGCRTSMNHWSTPRRIISHFYFFFISRYSNTQNSIKKKKKEKT